MKKILNSAWIFLALFAFAQVSNAQNLQVGDTVTIRNTNGNTYMRFNGSNSNITSTTSLTSDNINSCLWVISSLSAGNRTIVFRSLSNSGQYLYSNGSNNSTLRTGGTGTEWVYSSSAGGVAGKSMTTTLQRGSNGRYVQLNGTTWRYNNSSTNLTIEKWTKIDNHPFTPNLSVDDNTVFSWWKQDMDARTISFAPTLDGRTYYKNISTNAEVALSGSIITSPATLWGSPYQLRISWKFKKSGTKTSDMSSTDYTNAINQTMMTAGDIEGAYYSGSTWKSFTVTPNGPSPMNIRDKITGNMCDYVDVLEVTFTYNDGVSKTVVEEIPFTRKTFREETDSMLLVNIDPNTYTFKAASGLTKDVTMGVSYEEETRLIWLSNGEETEYSSRITLSEELDLLTTDGLTYTPNLVSGWLTVAFNPSTRKLALTAERNESNVARQAEGTVTVRYTRDSKGYEKVVDLHYTQAGKAGSGVVEFRHQRGLSNSPLDSHGYQQVHEHETTIYYYPEENIYLQIKQNTFCGYARWYDYDTDKNPEHNTNSSDKTTWYRLPAGRENFVDLNPDDEVYNAGLVATYTTPIGTAYNKLVGHTQPNNPILVGWADGKAHKMAVDVSMYTDYTITSTSFVEPTLSYRQIFNLRPATEIADSIAKCTGDTYYEDYTYLAPAGKTIYLTPNFRYRATDLDTHESDKCYFYYDTSDGNKLKNIGGTYNLKSGSTWNAQATWYKNGTQISSPNYMSSSYDYLRVTAGTAGQSDTYTLRITVGGQTLNIARFVVEYRAVTECGPSATEIISQQKIQNNYIPLSENDFSYGKPAPGTTDLTFLNYHMPWKDASYGYYYTPEAISHEASQTPEFPHYGEYALLNMVDKTWCHGENHGGAANGYCMYVDGTEVPGVVASISTDASICAGQDIYCSLWILYDYDQGNPIFRFNVQGRNSDSEPWTDVAVFMAGQITSSTHWQQVVFPVTALHDYSHVRVNVYNFSATTAGNDFLIDDLSLFASKLPLAAYQANTTCTTGERITTIIRMDYMSISDDWSNPYWYYDIYNETDGTEVEVSNFYHADTSEDPSTTHGSIEVYPKSYNPQTTRPEDIYTSIAAFIDTVHARAERGVAVPVEGFVKETVLGQDHWIAYFVHDVFTLNAQSTYTVRMAAAVEDLPRAMCALRTPLPVTDRTALSINGENIVSPVTNICANGLFHSVVDISNMLPDRPDVKLSAECMADWLWGFQTDSIYHEKNATQEEKAQANRDFTANYGYDRTTVRSALQDLRRAGDSQNPNPNRFAKSFDEIKRTGFSNEANYEVIKDLYEKELLTIGQKEMNLFLGSGKQARFWIYPVAGSAVATYTDEHGNTQEVELELCDEPQWLDMQTKKSTYQLNMGTRPYEELTEAEKLEIPGVRVAACLAKDAIKVPVSNISANVVIGRDSTMVIASDDAAVQAMIDRYGIEDPAHFSMRYFQDRLYSEVGDAGYYKTGDNIIYGAVNAAHVAALKAEQQEKGLPDGQPGYWHPNTDNLKAGYTYRMKTTMLSKRSGSAISEADPSCPVGEAYFNLIIIPDTMIWRPAGKYANEWGDDRNWHAWVNGEEWDHGWAPLPQTHVVIPELDDEDLYPYVSGTPFSFDANYVTDMCRKIYFAPGAKFENQNDLQYQDAVVDVAIPTDDWYGVAAPLQNVYSGDFYSPKEEDKDWFTAKTCEGRNDKAGFRYYGAYYNMSVQNLHYDTGWKTRQAQADWVASNSVDKVLAPGHGMGIAVFGPKGGSASEGVVRMPKQETSYDMYNAQGEHSQIDSTTFGGLDRSNASKFAFQLDKGKNYQTITLNNEKEENRFLFGNPTMAYIDMYKFAMDNDLQPYIYYMSQSSWRGVQLTSTSAERFLAPTQAVLVVAKEIGKELELYLALSHLTSNKKATSKQKLQAPVKRAPVMEEERHGIMRIDAYNEDGKGITSLAYNNYASNKYDVNEDALFISSGVLADNDGGVVTPFNIFTMANDTSLSVNVRNTFAQIPLAFLIMDDYYSDSLTLEFTLSQTWDEEMYFCDSKDGKRVRIYDATMIRIETPNNYEQRYYLQGMALNDEDYHTPTVIEEIKANPEDNNGPTELGVAKWIENGLLVIRRDGKLYNAQGQIMRVLK